MGAAVGVFLLLLTAVCGAVAQIDSCGGMDPKAFLAAPFNETVFSCRPMWNNFVLRYYQDNDSVLSIVLSTVYTTGWVGMGFSKDGMMVGSSAMVGWIGKTGQVHIKQFDLRGQTSSQVVVDQGQLQSTGVSPVVVLYGADIFLAFQLKFSAPVTRQNLLFAIGTAIPVNNVLQKHTDKVSISFDFSAGTTSASSYPYQLKRSHGALAIFGWGVLLPIGALVARYCKRWDPLWYYLHVSIQLIGFIIGLAAVVAGISLYDQLHTDISTHRGLGIFIFVLGILQVIAFFLRPDTDSKIRRYWNWYHHWSGRLVLFLAVVNIFLGIHAADAGTSWKVVYGINLAVLLLATIILEVLLWTRWSRKTVTTATTAL